MLRETGKIINNIKYKHNFEDSKLFAEHEEKIPLEKALAWAVVVHASLSIILCIFPILLQFLGFNIDLFKKPSQKVRDIEFVLVNQPEQEPINKNTPLRADRNTRAGGIHDPNKKIAPPQPAAPKPKPEQFNNKAPKKIAEVAKPTPKQQPVKQAAATQPKPQAQPKPQPKPKPAPPKPTAMPTIPPTKAPTAMKLPIPPTKGANKISAVPTGPISSRPNGTYSGHSTGSTPRPVAASGGYGRSASTGMPSNRGTGAGSHYSPGGANAGNPGPGNRRGPAGVDAIREPNFGPYMSELSRRIKANWDPPRGEESKRVVLLFTIARDGKLLNVKVVKSSGTPAADRAALAAVELTAPFRPLPADFRGPNVDIQFTFDYNVFGGRRY